MFYSLSIWARGFWLGLQRPGRLRRSLFTIAVFIPWVFVRSAVTVGRALDHVVYPGFRKQPIERPVYVIGSPRSGTTFLHSLLALDRERFTSLKLYETLLPSILLCRLAELAGRIDRLLGRPFGRVMNRIEGKAFAGWDDVHATALGRHEEPEGTWVLRMLTPAIYLLFPFFDELPELADLGAVKSERARRSAVRFYLGTLRRHLHVEAVRGRERSLLVKTVLFPSRIDAVTEALPDVRYIYLIRDPRKTVPSALSMFTAPWKVHSPLMVGRTPETARFAEVFVDGYRKYASVRERMPAEQWLTVDFADLVDDPDGAVGRIYDHLGYELSPELAARLGASAREARDRRSRHHYTLEQFGLTAREIEEALPAVIAESVPADLT